jgi:hypothetical protein
MQLILLQLQILAALQQQVVEVQQMLLIKELFKVSFSS